MTDVIAKPRVILLGDENTGKSSFIKKLQMSDIKRQHMKRLGVVKYFVPIITSLGKIEFEFWDTVGQERFGLLRDAYFLEADLVLLFFDVTRKDSYIHLSRWYNFLIYLAHGTPIILVASKVDMPNRIVTYNKTLLHRRRGMQYVEISNKTNYGIEKLINMCSQAILGQNQMEINQELHIKPPEKEIDSKQMSMNEDLIISVNQKPLPQANPGPQQAFFGANAINNQEEMEEDLINDLANEE